MILDELRKEQILPVVVADHEGLITYVNKPFEEIFGYQSEEVIGKPLTIIIPETLRDAHHLGFSRFLTTETPTLIGKPLSLKAVTKRGKEFDAEHIIMAEKVGGRWVFGASIRPIKGI